MELIMEALLVFFLNLTIRMRLDRLDGVGEIMWSDDTSVDGILKGFFESLALKPPNVSLTGPLIDCFRNHLLACSRIDFLDLNLSIVETYHPQAPEVPVIRQHLKKHVDNLYNAIKHLR
jgi:hypothetical protein